VTQLRQRLPPWSDVQRGTVVALTIGVVAAVLGIPPAAAIAASFARRTRDLMLGVGTLGIVAVGDVSSAILRLRY
jgi:hypothetical protein